MTDQAVTVIVGGVVSIVTAMIGALVTVKMKDVKQTVKEENAITRQSLKSCCRHGSADDVSLVPDPSPRA